MLLYHNIIVLLHISLNLSYNTSHSRIDLCEQTSPELVWLASSYFLIAAITASQTSPEHACFKSAHVNIYLHIICIVSVYVCVLYYGGNPI